MNDNHLFGRVLAALEASGIPFMLTGSYASAFYGDPRSTMDIDLVIDPTTEQLRAFAASFTGDRYYVSLPAALDALNRRSMFNVVDLHENWKADLIVRKDRLFSRVEFDRRTEGVISGRRVPVATAEDVIISKLEWAKAGGSRRQVEDAAGILVMQPNLDRTYIADWVRQLGLEPEWRDALAAAGATDEPRT